MPTAQAQAPAASSEQWRWWLGVLDNCLCRVCLPPASKVWRLAWSIGMASRHSAYSECAFKLPHPIKADFEWWWLSNSVTPPRLLHQKWMYCFPLWCANLILLFLSDWWHLLRVSYQNQLFKFTQNFNYWAMKKDCDFNWFYFYLRCTWILPL